MHDRPSETICPTPNGGCQQLAWYPWYFCMFSHNICNWNYMNCYTDFLSYFWVAVHWIFTASQIWKQRNPFQLFLLLLSQSWFQFSPIESTMVWSHRYNQDHKVWSRMNWKILMWLQIGDQASMMFLSLLLESLWSTAWRHTRNWFWHCDILEFVFTVIFWTWQ